MARTHPKTLVETVAALPKGRDRGFRFIDSKHAEHYFRYEDLEAEAKRRALSFVAAGIDRGQRVSLVIPEGHEFVLSFLGAVFAGAVPVPIFPRATFKAIESYHDTLRHIIDASGSVMLLTSESMLPMVEPVTQGHPVLRSVVVTENFFKEEVSDKPLPVLDEDDLCFLQFTSGSTSKPKGVMVRHRNLIANATAFLGEQGLNRTDKDVGVSWLPLFHDMGLIGFILGTLVCDIPVVILPTATFARGPRIWLETIQKYKGTITYAPNFAYALATKRLRDRDVESLDLSSLRVAGCGAEPIHAETLRQFADRLAPAGFSPNAYLPSYGMAEATLAITFHDHTKPIETDWVDAAQLRQGFAQPVAPDTDNAQELVCCGVGFPGHELAILDEQGNNLPARRVGEVVVRGPSVTDGYYNNEAATAEAWKGGWMHTGDLGYLAEGKLYICGRAKDLIIIRGANHYPQDLEWQVDHLPGVRRGNVVAFSVMAEGEEKLVIVAEASSADAPHVRHAIAAKINEAVGLQVYHVAVVPVGTIPKTSSGKPQRRKTKLLFEENRLVEHPLST